MKQIFTSDSPAQTVKIAESFAASLNGGDVVSLYGDLGLGKTQFVKGLAKGLGFNGDVTSPTFNIVNEYLGGKLNIYHFDMYRITGWNDLYSAGYFEYLDMGGIVVTEWSENIEAAIPQNSYRVTLERIDDSKRKITVER